MLRRLWALAAGGLNALRGLARLATRGHKRGELLYEKCFEAMASQAVCLNTAVFYGCGAGNVHDEKNLPFAEASGV
jgi:hypothetical protein